MNKNISNRCNVLVIGVGNTLLSDDGFGIHVVEAMQTCTDINEGARFLDGGTIGLNLLPDIEDADHLIVVDAAEMGEKPGVLSRFVDEAMDDHLSRHKSTVHEVAMSDLLCAARLSGHMPKSRCLIAVQPASTDWGLSPTGAVRAAVERACEMVADRIREVHP
jgi:hydrogenase maturation protease